MEWVRVTRRFYREFPRALKDAYRTELRAQRSEVDLSDCYPKPWKTVGDEILFCCRLHDLYHAGLCIDAFLHALREHGKVLTGEGAHLDVKGCAWIAAFPWPNVTVRLNASSFTADQFDEEFELAADRDPAQHDFLGNGIDAGFRVAQHCASDRCSVSLELAWLLALGAARESGEFPFKWVFRYLGRHSLKGVIQGKPYPVVAIDTERSARRRTIRQDEEELLGRPPADARKLANWLWTFMEDEKDIQPPFLPQVDQPGLNGPPANYNEHRDLWLREADEVLRAAALEKAAGEAPAEGDATLPEQVTRMAEDIKADARERAKDLL